MRWTNRLSGCALAAQLAACSSITVVAPEDAKASLELLSPAEAPSLVTVPPGMLVLRYRDADNDYFVSDKAFTYSVFGKIVAVPGAGICRPHFAPFKIGVFIAAGGCDYGIKAQPSYRLHEA